jgi:hypothetical protein
MEGKVVKEIISGTYTAELFAVFGELYGEA